MSRFLIVFCLLAAPVFAQTQIGGGTCSSSSLNGAYGVTLSGRQVSTTGNFATVFQAVGAATFDGQSAVTLTLTESTNQASGMALMWSGTYSVQANCAATVTITSGGSATLNVVIYNLGKDFQLTGEDANYVYSGSGNVQPTSTCSTATLSGSYTFNTTGFALTSGAVSGAADSAGLLQFDGNGNVTVTDSTSTSNATNTPSTLTGTYSVSPSCLGTATLTDASSHAYSMTFSIYSVSATSTNLYVALSGASQSLMLGTAHSITAGSCSASNLSGVYALTLSGRSISTSGNFAGSLQSVGTATFDGVSSVTIAGTYDTNMSQATTFSYTGTYTVPSNCDGTGSIVIAGPAVFTLVVWDGGKDFDLVGSDQMFVYSGSGTNVRPVSCALSTLSGEYTFATAGFTLSGTTQNGSENEVGLLQFDGQGHVTASYTANEAAMPAASETATGTYTVTSACAATATLGDSAGLSNAFNFVIEGLHGESLVLTASNSGFDRTGSAHSAFTNPSQSITNVASYAYSATPPGSVFALFGLSLATKAAGTSSTTLPTTLLTTTVTVNGEKAPLFYVSATQIDAQMPWDIPGGAVASVIVTNGSSASNAAAVYVPSTGTPGISEYGNDRAVVVNQDGSVNSGSTAASVGDEVVAYFTGGGPVMASGTLTSGHPAPSGLSPVTGTNSITVGGVAATAAYIGLTPGSIGLYQANFTVPQLAKGTYPVVITIAGQASNNPVITVSN